MYSNIFLLFTPLLALAAPSPAPPKKLGPPSGLALPVDQNVDCKGSGHKASNILYDDAFETSPAIKSYMLSRDLNNIDYLTFASAKPFIVTMKSGDAGKKGCHDLKDPAFFYMFQKNGGGV